MRRETTTIGEIIEGLRTRPPGFDNGVTVPTEDDAAEIAELADFPVSYAQSWHAIAVWRMPEGSPTVRAV